MNTQDLVPAELRAKRVVDGYCPGLDLMTLFEERMACHPDKLVVIDDAGSVTYAELAAEARILRERVAATLASAG